MPEINSEVILNTSAEILADKGTIQIRIEKRKIKLKLPTTREIAETLHVPHYYVLPALSVMEESGILTREERVGIWTTDEGTKILIRLMREKFPEKCDEFINPDILKALTDYSAEPL
jgi:DNA-binding transcriptional regulator YhcF (GntR family)